MKIVIEEYNPEWKTVFEKESGLLSQSIGDPDIVIEHIGSTSVEGLGAKPVIDIMIGVADFKSVNCYIGAIEKLGYTYVSKYEDTMPYRRFFTKDSSGKRTHHIHMVEIDTEFWKRHLKFRDELRNNDQYRDDYYKLKLELSEREWVDGNEYAGAKSDFIKGVESK